VCRASTTSSPSSGRRWFNGDPSGFLEIADDDVVYFVPFLSSRLDGKKALADYYEGIRGQVKADRFELLNPRVQPFQNVAVLTFNFVSWGGNEDQFRWNCTEVFRRSSQDWKIVQTHWSFSEAGLPVRNSSRRRFTPLECYPGIWRPRSSIGSIAA
jgi:hypothetical protein